jgi:hypothetical protein
MKFFAIIDMKIPVGNKTKTAIQKIVARILSKSIYPSTKKVKGAVYITSVSLALFPKLRQM